MVPPLLYDHAVTSQTLLAPSDSDTRSANHPVSHTHLRCQGSFQPLPLGLPDSHTHLAFHVKHQHPQHLLPQCHLPVYPASYSIPNQHPEMPAKPSTPAQGPGSMAGEQL
uniref:Uncharacterized protein n=1 Tax=Opuntia streptacantha TaxID=393608 RepID=A0A7C8ZR78_OPUST